MLTLRQKAELCNLNAEREYRIAREAERQAEYARERGDVSDAMQQAKKAEAAAKETEELAAKAENYFDLAFDEGITGDELNTIGLAANAAREWYLDAMYSASCALSSAMFAQEEVKNPEWILIAGDPQTLCRN